MTQNEKLKEITHDTWHITHDKWQIPSIFKSISKFDIDLNRSKSIHRKLIGGGPSITPPWGCSIVCGSTARSAFAIPAVVIVSVLPFKKCSAPKSGSSRGTRTGNPSNLTKLKSIGSQSGNNLVVKERSLVAGKYRLLFCWKVLLLYGDTCHLILRRGIETRKVVVRK